MAKAIPVSRYIGFLLALAFGLFAGLAVLNWRIDPLQYYRRATYPAEFSDQTRFQNPGLARNFPYDTAIIGTSISRGLDIQQLRSEFGWDAINLSMQGASAREQSLMLEVALRSGRVRRVLWDVNCEFLRGRSDWVSDFEGAFPAYLYDSEPFNKIPNYLLNVDTTKSTARILLYHFGVKLYRPRSVAELSGLEPGRKLPGKEALLRKWSHDRRGLTTFGTNAADFTPELLDTSFDENFLRVIRAHPEIDFELWFPPFSVFYYSIARGQSEEAFASMLACKAHILEQTQSLPNVRLYDFQAMPELVLDLDHYFDPVHFDAFGYGLVLQDIAGKRRMETPELLSTTGDFLRRESAAQSHGRN